MSLFIIIQASPHEQAAAIVAREALHHAATALGVALDVRIQPAILPLPQATAGHDALLLLCDAQHLATLKAQQAQLLRDFGGAQLHISELSAVLADAAGCLQRLLPPSPVDTPKATHIVAVTSCPTGIAHTFMAADALQEAAKALGLELRVETQGSVGAGTPLTAEEIAQADLVIIAADREVDRSRFAGKRLFTSDTKAAITQGQALIGQALREANIHTPVAGAADIPAAAPHSKNLYSHLMNGVSFMLPFVVAGGLLIALAFALGGIDANKNEGTLAHTLFTIGANGAFALMVPILAGYIAYSIADRPALVPGMVGGMVAQHIGAGFLGGILAGFIAGYSVQWLLRSIHLPRSLAGLMPVLILPLLSTLITGLLMFYVIGTPVASVLQHLSNWLASLQGGLNALLLGAILGAMMAVDMGGPVNKAAYAFSVAMVAQNITQPMAATMIAGMTPPVALALAAWLFPRKFTHDEQSSKGATCILGLAFISEGAIPFAARDPLRVIPCLMAGSAVAGAVAMGTQTALLAPHGGVFLLPIPGAVVNYGGYALALAAGVVVSALCLGVFKKTVDGAEGVPKKTGDLRM